MLWSQKLPPTTQLLRQTGTLQTRCTPVPSQRCGSLAEGLGNLDPATTPANQLPVQRQDLIASLNACHPARTTTLVERVPSLKWMSGTPAVISHNHSKTGVDDSEPAAAHIRGTLTRDHRCWRTMRGTREPTGTAPTRLANSWKRTSAARTCWCLG